jgi:hypothetical protein
MIRTQSHTLSRPLSVVALLALGACLPGRAATPDERILEPRWSELSAVPAQEDAVDIHIHPIRARSNITTSLLYRRPTGEIQTDPVWSWSVGPSYYLSQVLGLVASADATVRLTDNSRGLSLQIELVSFEIEEGEGGPWARIAVLARVRRADRRVDILELDERAQLQGEMPQSLSRAMGRCLVEISRAALTQSTNPAK